MGKSTINHPFSMAMLVYQRVNLYIPGKPVPSPHLNHRFTSRVCGMGSTKIAGLRDDHMGKSPHEWGRWSRIYMDILGNQQILRILACFFLEVYQVYLSYLDTQKSKITWFHHSKLDRRMDDTILRRKYPWNSVWISIVSCIKIIK